MTTRLRPGPGCSRRAIALVAALSLVVQVLLLGSGVASMRAAGAAMPSADGQLTHGRPAHVHPDCPDHDGTPDPVDHQQGEHHRGFCCILCGKVEAFPGALPAVLSILAPARAVSTVEFGRERRASGGTASVFPVGARAPPRLG
jgi:hypothetical protein